MATSLDTNQCPVEFFFTHTDLSYSFFFFPFTLFAYFINRIPNLLAKTSSLLFVLIVENLLASRLVGQEVSRSDIKEANQNHDGRKSIASNNKNKKETYASRRD